MKSFEAFKPQVLTLLDRYKGPVLPPTVREHMGLACVQRWSNTEKTVSSKVKKSKTVNEC